MARCGSARHRPRGPAARARPCAPITPGAAMANATILITGGCGFFGTWIIRRLLDDGDHPVVMDLKANPARWRLLMTDQEIAALPFHALAIDDTAAVTALVGAVRPQAIIHLAGLQVPSCRSDPVGGARVNVIG